MMDSSVLANDIVRLAENGDIAAANRLLAASKFRARRGELYARSFRLQLLFGAILLVAAAATLFFWGLS
jgi:hypothetical protein